jgi:hypothetical protein
MAIDIVDFLMKPSVAFIIMILFLTGYLVFISLEGGFSKKFLHFGPGKDAETQTQFLGMKLDSWTKVILLYIISFFAAMVQAYYGSVMSLGIHSYLWNVTVTEMPHSKFWTYVIIVTEPIIYQILYIINLFVNLTLQLQFILPGLLGGYLASLPFDLKRLSTKTFKL